MGTSLRSIECVGFDRIPSGKGPLKHDPKKNKPFHPSSLIKSVAVDVGEVCVCRMKTIVSLKVDDGGDATAAAAAAAEGALEQLAPPELLTDVLHGLGQLLTQDLGHVLSAPLRLVSKESQGKNRDSYGHFAMIAKAPYLVCPLGQHRDRNGPFRHRTPHSFPLAFLFPFLFFFSFFFLPPGARAENVVCFSLWI